MKGRSNSKVFLGVECLVHTMQGEALCRMFITFFNTGLMSSYVDVRLLWPLLKNLCVKFNLHHCFGYTRVFAREIENRTCLSGVSWRVVDGVL